MRTLALTDAQVTAWWIALAVGLVVVLVVAGLLEALRRTVVQVERAVDEVWAKGKLLAQNTQASRLLSTTRARAGDVEAEIEQHRAPEERR